MPGEIQHVVPDTYAGLFWAYFAFWAVLTLYLLALGRKVEGLRKQLEESKGDSAPE